MDFGVSQFKIVFTFSESISRPSSEMIKLRNVVFCTENSQLFRLDKESSFLEFLKDFADLLLMFLESARIDQDVIDITNAEDIKVFTKGIIHESLGSSRSIGEPKGHNEEFKQSITSPEGGFFIHYLS